jgi:hypothetical protein
VPQVQCRMLRSQGASEPMPIKRKLRCNRLRVVWVLGVGARRPVTRLGRPVVSLSPPSSPTASHPPHAPYLSPAPQRMALPPPRLRAAAAPATPNRPPSPAAGPGQPPAPPF